MAIILPKDWTISAERYRGPRPSSDSKQSNSEHKGSTNDKESDNNKATLMGIKLSFLLKVLNDDLLNRVKNHDVGSNNKKNDDNCITMSEFLEKWNKILKEKVSSPMTLHILIPILINKYKYIILYILLLLLLLLLLYIYYLFYLPYPLAFFLLINLLNTVR